MNRSEYPGLAGLDSDEVLFEAAYLVSRGVRALSMNGHVTPDRDTMCTAYGLLASAVHRHGSSIRAIPFVALWKDGSKADCGYVARSWVLDLYQWARSNEIPNDRLTEIQGLLLGYSPDAIADFREHRRGVPPVAQLAGSGEVS